MSVVVVVFVVVEVEVEDEEVRVPTRTIAWERGAEICDYPTNSPAI